ncbi:MAG: VOC family protein [Paenibacillaceae bacterium]
MAKLSPYIYSEDARQQAEFYVKALRGEIISIKTYADMPHAPEEMKDQVMHLVLKVGEQQFYLADSSMIQSGNQIDITLEFDTESEAILTFAGLSEGGEVIMPFEKMFRGTMFGRVEDPYGVRWQIATV